MRIDLRSLGNRSPDARAQKISQLAVCVHVAGVSANRFIAYPKDASPAPAREQPPVHVSTSSYIAAVGYPSFCRCVWDGLGGHRSKENHLPVRSKKSCRVMLCALLTNQPQLSSERLSRKESKLALSFESKMTGLSKKKRD